MKVISFNVGYFLGYTGSHYDYVRHPFKSLRGSRYEKDNMDEFAELVSSEEPDAVLMQEVDGGSFRSSFDGQLKYLSEKLPDRYSFNHSNKYRGIFFPRLPLFRKMGNGMIFTEGEVIDHAIDHGRKNLVQELKLDDFSIFSLHLATFGQYFRRKQLKDIKKLAEKRSEYVLAGDLNFHRGEKEVKHLERLLGNKVMSPAKTFPANNPHQRLDLVTASRGLEISNLEELGNRFSDHRPVMFEVEPKE